LLTESLIENTVIDLIRLSVTELPLDVHKCLEEAYKNEKHSIGKIQLKNMLDNLKLAKELRRPLCQDTGLINFYFKVGSNFSYLGKIEASIRRAVEKATFNVPLRPNAVDPITNDNTGNNIGRYVPFLNWEITSGDHLEITVVPKGGGSENACRLGMLLPQDGVEGLKRFVIKTVTDAGGTPCPPTIIGIGVGGGADVAMKLAKVALLRPLKELNTNKTLAAIEKEIYASVNASGIGPMGLGGNNTTLAVKIEYAHRHPASYPVAIAFQCWAARRASAKIGADGSVEYLTHIYR